MFLPVGATIKFAIIPQFDKNSIPNIAAFLGCMLVVRKRISLSNGFGLAELFIVALLVGPFITSALNGDDILIGDRILPGVGIYDAGSSVIAQLIVLLPFFIGRQIFRGETDVEDILRVLVIAGLVYSVLMLLDSNKSATPQLDLRLFSLGVSTGNARWRV